MTNDEIKQKLSEESAVLAGLATTMSSNMFDSTSSTEERLIALELAVSDLTRTLAETTSALGILTVKIAEALGMAE